MIKILIDLGQYGNIYWVRVMGTAWHAKRSAISDQSCDSYRPHGISKWGSIVAIWARWKTSRSTWL